MDTNIYTLLVSLIGTPTTENERSCVYLCCCILVIFVLYSLLNLVLTLFKWIWGK